MWVVLKMLGWFGTGLVAWMLLSVACLSVMYARGWLSPKRAERIREHEDALSRGDAGAGEGESTREVPAVTPMARPRRAR